MKRTFLLFFSVWLSVKMVGQAPAQMNYQGVARNNFGIALANQNIKLRLSVRDGSANGTVVYQETRLVKTNYLGMFSVAIGGPGKTNFTGDLLAVNWNTGGAKFLQVEMDPMGGNDLKDMGATQLLSVPYALAAGSAIPSGVAGGMLSGTYPNPTISNGVVTTAHLANNSVTTVKLADGVVTTPKIADGSITASKLAAGLGLPATGAAGGDLTGNFPNPNIKAGSVSNTKIADGAVGTTKIEDGSVTNIKIANSAIDANKLANNAVTNSKLAANAVDNNNLIDGAVDNAKLANNSVTTTKIADASITTSKIVNGAVDGTKLANSSVDANKLANNAVTNTKIADDAVGTSKIADGSITAPKLAAGLTIPPGGAANGDLTGTYPDPTIKANAVTGAKIADGAVGSTKIADGAVGSTKLADGSVSTIKIANAAVDGTKLANNAVTNTKIADDAVGTSKIADGSITAPKLAAGLTIPPGGAANGDLTGTYPDPTIKANAVTGAKIADGAVGSTKIADDAVGTSKIADGSITAPKLAAGLTIPPGGAANGDLTGTYPDPTIKANAVTGAKIADGAVGSTKIADGAVGTTKLADGSVSTIKIANSAVDGTKLADGAVGALKIADGAVGTTKLADGSVSTIKLANAAVDGTKLANNAVTNTKIADDAVGTSKIADGSITGPKLAAGLTIPPGGAANGDLTGTYPDPTIKANAVTGAKIADGAVGSTKLADGAVDALKIADGAVSTTKLADGSVSTIKIANAAVDGTKLADASVTSAKIVDASIGTAKINDGAVVTAKVADDAITTPKIANNAISTGKIIDAAITTAKIADGAITSDKLATGLSLPPGGNATGDLGGTFPSPTVAKIQGVGVSNTAPASGEVLMYNGTNWAPAPAPVFTLPFTRTVNVASQALHITNDGDGNPIEGSNNSTSINVAGVVGTLVNESAGAGAAGVKGVSKAITSGEGYGILGIHEGAGTAIRAQAVNGTGLYTTSEQGFALKAYSEGGTAAGLESGATSSMDVLTLIHQGSGAGMSVVTNSGIGVLAVSADALTQAILAMNVAGGEAMVGRTTSDDVPAITGVNDGLFAAVMGINNAPGGTGMLAQANSIAGDPLTEGNALVAEILGDAAGNVAVFKAGGANVARIAADGTGYFNGGTVNNGADVAELFDVEGARNAYEAGDVLVISETSDRMVTKSATPYSTLVAGVYATKPGLMLTEKNVHENLFDKMVPMGVIGVIPTKVCLEGGAIKRGDLLVTSSLPGVAMKADPDKVKVGQVLGKALQDYNTAGTGKINVLVSVK